MPTDYKVRYRSEDDIEALALQCRLHVEGYAFNLMIYLRTHMLQHTSKKGMLRLKTISLQSKNQSPFISFDPLTLNASQRLINATELNLPYARYIMAHEIGHIIMHNHHPSYFSELKGPHLKFLPKEESAEWQAQCFAGYFLVTDSVLFEAKPDIADLCKVPHDLINDRQTQIEKRMQRKFYVPNTCECGQSIARRSGLILTCYSCGKREQL